MQVQFIAKLNGPERLVCDAEVLFDEPDPLVGTKLVGFSLWRSTEGDVYVTFPSRAFGAGTKRKYFDYLRSTDGASEAVRNVKDWILVEFRKSRRHDAAAGGNGGDPTSRPYE
jgi:hypothetical protein